jgi:hypothetical protein
VCEWVFFECGLEVRGALCRVVWRACGGVHAVMFALCGVVTAVRDVVRACGACVIVRACECAMCGAWLVDVRCFASGWRAPRCLRAVVLCGACRNVCVFRVARACVWCDGCGKRGAMAEQVDVWCSRGVIVCD